MDSSQKKIKTILAITAKAPITYHIAITVTPLLLSSEPFFTIITLLSLREISEGNFFTTFTLLWLRGRLCDSEFIGTQLLPSSLNCRPLAAA